MTQAPPPRFYEAVRLFNAQQFFECHEVLEDLWRPLPPGPEKTFYQGILQIGVGYHHLLHQNWVGTRNKLIQGLEKLRPLVNTEPYSHWIHLKELVTISELNLNEIQSLGAERLKEFPEAKIPTILID